MAPAAIHGAWVAMTHKPPESTEFVERTMNALINTCRLWRADGPFVDKYSKNLKLNTNQKEIKRKDS
jgi:hypothetical protein